MIEVRESIVIDCPPEEAFAVVTDFSREPQWRPAIEEVRYLTEAGADGRGVGTTLRYYASFLGKRIESTVRITGYEPDRMLAFETISGPVVLRGQDTFEPSDDGRTRLTVHHRSRFKGILRLLEPVIGIRATRDIRSDLQNLRGLMESGGHKERPAERG